MRRYNFYNSDWHTNGVFSIENSMKLDFTLNFIKSMAEEIDKLEKELDAVKAENAKDEIVTAALDEAKKYKEERDEAIAQNYYGITKEDRDRADEWWLQHTEKEREELSRQHRYLGKAAHRIGFIIKPTEAGPIKEAYCSCGQKLDLTKNTEFG